MIKPSIEKPPEFKFSHARHVFDDEFYVKKGVICLYFNNPIYAPYVLVSIDELRDFKQAQKVLKEVYQDASEDGSSFAKSKVEYIVGKLFRMGVIQK